jgi:carbamoylphosphate synthase small subunit
MTGYQNFTDPSYFGQISRQCSYWNYGVNENEVESDGIRYLVWFVKL